MSEALPQWALPYSMPCRYFLAFWLRRYTAMRNIAAPAIPNSRSVEWKLGSTFEKAAEKPSEMAMSRAEKSSPGARRKAWDALLQKYATIA